MTRERIKTILSGHHFDGAAYECRCQSRLPDNEAVSFDYDEWLDHVAGLILTEGNWLGVNELPADTPHLFVVESEGNAALYVDGLLDESGAAAEIDDRIRTLTGVVSAVNFHFRHGDEVAGSLDELRELTSNTESRKVEAAMLRTRAKQILAEAKKLDPEGATE